MSKFAKLLKLVVSATKRPELPEDHTGSQASMAAQRATGQAEANMQDALKAAATERNGACDRLLKFLGRAFGSRTDPMATRRAQRVAVKAVAFMSKNEALFATIADAEARAFDALTRTYGSIALEYPTDKQLDELYGLTLRHGSPTARTDDESTAAYKKSSWPDSRSFVEQ
ncbi:hypothetical protein [Paraburkholderia sp. CI3]|uniref:hypothetical protein n=1 Tax=Paraburkholderia sp. CI3 TaxID=2991060 RepID=UPI003D1DE8AC